MNKDKPLPTKPENNPNLIRHEESEKLIADLYQKNKLSLNSN